MAILVWFATSSKAHAGWVTLVDDGLTAGATAVRLGCVAPGQYERQLVPLARTVTIEGLPDTGRCWFALNAGPQDEWVADFAACRTAQCTGGRAVPGAVRNLAVVWEPTPATPPAQTLVDFGSTASGNVFGLTGWTTVIRDVYTDYRAIGPGGLTIVVGNNGTYNFQGVTGPARSFPGECVRMTWFNGGATPAVIAPRVSFNGAGRTFSGGTWFSMTAATIPAGMSGTTQYCPVAGSYSLVNVASGYWGPSLIADKIELVAP